MQAWRIIYIFFLSTTHIKHAFSAGHAFLALPLVVAMLRKHPCLFFLQAQQPMIAVGSVEERLFGATM